MDNRRYVESVKNTLAEILDKIDFKSGVIQERTENKQNDGCILDVKWKKSIHFILYINKWNGSYRYCAERNGDAVSWSRYASKQDDKFFQSVQHLVNEIENGDFDSKKTINDRIGEIVCERQLTSYMNNTKWKEFIYAMDEEMSIAVPYDYKTLFEEDRAHLQFDRHYDAESFNGYHFKSIEWVKVKPQFYESKHRGMLIEDEKIYFDVRKEFVDLMDRYSIPYEYDEINDIYTIYGYK